MKFTVHAIAILVLCAPSLGAQTAPAAPPSVVATDVTVRLSPAATAVQAGAKIQFTAAVSGTTAASLSWTATGGTVASGVYTAGSTPGTYTVSAALSDGTGSATARVVVSSGPPVSVFPGQDLAAAVANAASGTAFIVKSGTNRLTTSINPKSGDAFVGEPGAIVSGARLLTNWTQSGTYWAIGGQTQQGQQAPGSCQSTSPTCIYPEDLYIDDKLVQHVGSLSQVAPGKWFFDYAADTIYIGDNPTGHKVETNVVTDAFTGSATGVTISDLTIEKFANPAQTGAVHGNATTNWIVQNNEIRWNHGVGIRCGNGMRMSKNNVHHNGQLGVGGIGNNVLVEGNEIAFNNTAGYDPGWEAGGSKFVQTQGLIVRANHSHDNYGPGLWTDGDNQTTLYENNLVEGNKGAGIFHEISYSAVIRNNVIRSNGRPSAGWLWDAGIQIAASPNVEIYGNRVVNNVNGIAALQQNRGSGAYGPHIVQNLYVHDNTVTMTTGGTGLVQDVGDTSYFTSDNNRWVHNTYYLGSNTNYYAWMNSWWSESGWKAQGQDVTGTFIR